MKYERSTEKIIKVELTCDLVGSNYREDKTENGFRLINEIFSGVKKDT